MRLTLLALATTGGGSVLENKYGRDLCRSKSIKALGPVVYPPEIQELEIENKETF